MTINLDEAAATFAAGMHEVRGKVGELSREELADFIAIGTYLPEGVLRTLAVMAVLALLDEEGSHAMTQSSFEIFLESSAEERNTLRRLLDAAEQDLAVRRAQVGDLAAQIVDLTAERERLRDELGETVDRAVSAGWDYVALQFERDALRSDLEACARRRQELLDGWLLEREQLRSQRDEARDEVVKLGKENDGLRATIAVLAGRNEEFDVHPPVLVKPAPMTDLGLVGPLEEM